MRNGLTGEQYSSEEITEYKWNLFDHHNLYVKLVPKDYAEGMHREVLEGEDLETPAGSYFLYERAPIIDGHKPIRALAVGGNYKEHQDHDDIHFQGDVLTVRLDYPNNKHIFLRLSPSLDIVSTPIVSNVHLFELAYYQFVEILDPNRSIKIIDTTTIKIPDQLLREGQNSNLILETYMEDSGDSLQDLTEIVLEGTVPSEAESNGSIREEEKIQEGLSRVEKFLSNGLDVILERMLPQMIGAIIFGRDIDFRSRNVLITKDGFVNFIDLHQLLRITSNSLLKSYEIPESVEDSFDREAELLLELIQKCVAWVKSKGGNVPADLEKQIARTEAFKIRVKNEVVDYVEFLAEDEFDKLIKFQNKYLSQDLYSGDRVMRFWIGRIYELLELSGVSIKPNELLTKLGWI